MVFSTLVSRLTRLLLHPMVSGALLGLLLYRGPPTNLPASTVRAVKTALLSLLALGTTSRLNSALTRLALNNWRFSAPKGWKWDEEVAVVTGGSSGIGKAIVEGLTRKGVKVAVLDINELPPVLKRDPGVSFFRCDITSPAAVRDAAASVQAALGHPSILVNNAGITGSEGVILEDDPDHVRLVFEVNALSHWSTVKAFVPEMARRDKGHVVTVSSIASFGCRSGEADYSCSKAAVSAFHEGLGAELKYRHGARGVITTLVHPWWVRTGMTEANAEEIERVWGAMLRPEDIADEVLGNIFGRRGGQLIVPLNTTNLLFSTLRAWPIWLQTLVYDIYGR